MSPEAKTVAGFAALILGMIGLCFVCAYLEAGFKAAAYERATGVRIPRWDALCLDLRVEAKPKPAKP